LLTAGILAGIVGFLSFNVLPTAAWGAAGLWQDTSQASVRTISARTSNAIRERTLLLDLSGLDRLLAQAPRETFVGSGGKGLSTAPILSLPLPDGSMERFRIVESPVLAPALAERYPEIRTYAAVGFDDPESSARLDRTPHGFHAMIFSNGGTVYIDPLQRGDLSHYVSYWRRDARLLNGQAPFEGPLRRVDSVVNREAARLLSEGLITNTGPLLRTYRLAMGATGEYTQFHGGTVALGLAAITTAMNRVNGIYEREVSLRMELVANTDQLIFTDGNTDPYTNNDGNAMLGENQQECDNVIGDANYDVGHVFSTGGGGIAGLGVVCVSGTKGEGVTGSGNPTGDSFWVDFVAHELGHQWGASHTFNSTTGNCTGNIEPTTAYEPGSGTTIMGYAGICGVQDIQPNSDDYFHSASFDQIVAHIAAVGACGSSMATGNNTPVPEAGLGGFVIPISTPFELTGSATDIDGDTLSYCWEEFDLGPAGDPNTPTGTAPLFRSFLPVAGPTRVFPQLTDLLNNTQTIGEILPNYPRNMTFRLTARDGKGGVAHDQLIFTVSDAAGPFLVTVPNTSVSWTGGASEAVTWDVASTDQAPIECNNVDILLSTDGGNTFPIVLVANTPNDGTENILVPNAPTTLARVKVKAVGNAFFDLSNQDFTIVAGGPVCSVTDLAPGAQTPCDVGSNTYTQEVVVTFENAPVSGTLDVHGQSFAIGTSPQTVLLTGLPSNGDAVDVTASFSASPGCSRTENALFTAPASCAPCSITDLTSGRMVACSPGNNTYSQEVFVTYVGAPKTGGLDVNGQLFPVTGSPQKVVLSGLPVDGQAVNVTASFPSQGACSRTENGLFTAPASCTTTPTSTCMSSDPIDIPDNDPNGINDTITLSDTIQITNVRVFVDIEHDWIGDLIIEVQHNGTTVRLHDRSGGGTFDRIGWYPTDFTVDGPGSLADFNGQMAHGSWTLSVSDNEAPDAGIVFNWCVEVTGTPIVTNVDGNEDLPTVAAMDSGYPNPAPEGITNIRFALPAHMAVQVRIFDVAGRHVRTLHQGSLDRGRHQLLWDGQNQRGERVPSGIYFSVLQTESTRLQRKIVVVR
jgi:subtilisin-like proprotein convertase family protein